MRRRLYDICIIGGGALGLSVAKALSQKYPERSIGLLEKSSKLCQHLSKRQKGVLSSGGLSPPNSLKLKFCQSGKQQWESYCQEKNIKIEQISQFYIGQNAEANSKIEDLYNRSLANNAEMDLIEISRVKDLEPRIEHIDHNTMALHAQDSSIIDLDHALLELKNDAQNLENLEIVRNIQVSRVLKNSANGVELETFDTNSKSLFNKFQKYYSQKDLLESKIVINCAGLYSDRIARALGGAQAYGNLLVKADFLNAKLEDLDNNFPKSTIYKVRSGQDLSLMREFISTFGNEVQFGPATGPALWREMYDGIQNFSGRDF